jgi:lipoprotein-anchoring transpeptidase ErfK/SrfK
MRRVTISAACVLVIWMVALMSSEVSATQPQVSYNFSGSSFSGSARTASFAAPSRGGAIFRYSGSRIVDFDRALAPGSILVKTDERKLYFVLEGGKAVQYGIGVGREGFTWRGTKRISRKAEWPGWTPPARMIERERAKGVILPAHMPGGPDNPLGARALYLGDSLFRIHGTNQPHTIGHAVSSGCIRMLNDEVVDLHDRVKVGALVVVE